MLGHRELAFEDYVAILRRRKWWLIVPAIIFPIVAYGISLKLQNRFTSQTLVLVEPQKVPDQYVMPVVTEMINARLATMQEQILSRTRLQPIIERFGLYQDDPKLSMEEKVDKMRSAVSVRPVRADFGGDGTTKGLPGFYISFTSVNARLAQQVCGEITSMFMEENLKVREQSAQGTTNFLKSQLDDAKRNLDEQDAKLAKFKQQYIGQLPSNDQSNMNMLTSLNTQLEATTQAIGQLQQQKTYSETILSQQLENWKAMQATRGGETSPMSPELLQQQLAVAQTQLASLQQKYTETHPDVIKAKKDLAALQKRIDDANAAEEKASQEGNDKNKTVRQGLEPASIQQLRAQIHAIDLAIKSKQGAQADLQRNIKNIESRIQISPVVEEKYKQLTRDYQTALEFYNQLLNKKNQSEMATDLERRQQGEQFRVLDPPNLPEKPTFPNRPLFAAIGLGSGLAIGFIVGLLLEFRDKAMRTEQDVQYYLELPVLALMPAIAEGNGRKTARWKMPTRKKADQMREKVGA